QVFRTKAEPIATIYNRLDRDICARCPSRIFYECQADLPSVGQTERHEAATGPDWAQQQEARGNRGLPRPAAEPAHGRRKLEDQNEPAKGRRKVEDENKPDQGRRKMEDEAAG